MIEDRSLIQSYAVAFDADLPLVNKKSPAPLSKTEALELANSLGSMNIPYRISGGLWSCGLYTPCAVLRKGDLIYSFYKTPRHVKTYGSNDSLIFTSS